MANDPNRDILPVKEDCYRSAKGFNAKFDYQVLGKLSRCELEDRFLRLLDEQTHIKKLANSQEEKIKRLGTKLLRLISDRKNGKKFIEHNKETEELHLRIIELEHENYALKDKNTVLKQQLSNRSRHLVTHRSPNFSNHTSPLMTMRQSAPQTQSEIAYETANKTATGDVQLQEAEAQVRELNEEIKSLHNKIEYLQQNLEKNSLDTRKIKVTENIEFIRLQRSLKQQAIQIATLQAQVKNSENNQKILKEELVKAHKENDEALHLIAVKQNEILNLCSKLEEKNLSRLEEDELKSRVNDLMIERDCLKKRSDFLMKSIGAKAEEAEKLMEFQKQLAEEKYKREKLEETLEFLKKNSFKAPVVEKSEILLCEKVKTLNRSQQTEPEEKKETVNFAGDFSEESECSCNKCNHFLSACKCSQESFLNPELESDTEPVETFNTEHATTKKNSPLDGKCAAEKLKLKRELQYLKEMLRSQTSRCEAQQAEIKRLMYELKLNEEKCSETLQRLDWHLRIFQTFEMSEFEAIMRARQNERLSKPVVESVLLEPKPVQEKLECKESSKSKENMKPFKIVDSEVNVFSKGESPKISRINSKEYVKKRRGEFVKEENFLLKNSERRVSAVMPERDKPEKFEGIERRNRFVDQKFLDSSDEEMSSENAFKKSVKKNLKENDNDYDSWVKALKSRELDESDNQQAQRNNLQKSTVKENSARRVSSTSAYSNHDSEDSLYAKSYEKSNKKGLADQEKTISYIENLRSITVTILWFKVEPGSSLWFNNQIESLFIDFTFLDVNGAETETPESLPKPKNPNEQCNFNFSQTINLSEGKKELFQSFIHKPDMSLVIFKVVSDSEKLDETNGECEDIGVAIVTVREFLSFCNKGSFSVSVKSIGNTREIIGTLELLNAHFLGIRRKSYRFPRKRKYFNPNIFNDLSFPISLVPPTSENPDYESSFFVPLRRPDFILKYNRNHFPLRKWKFSNRKKLLSKSQRNQISTPDAPDSSQNFKHFWLLSPELYYEPHKNLFNSFGDIFDPQFDLIHDPNQYSVCVYPIFNRLKKRTFYFLKKPRYSALKRQYLINLRNKLLKNKRSASNLLSSTNEIIYKENKPKISKSENYHENVDVNATDFESPHKFILNTSPYLDKNASVQINNNNLANVSQKESLDTHTPDLEVADNFRLNSSFTDKEKTSTSMEEKNKGNINNQNDVDIKTSSSESPQNNNLDNTEREYKLPSFSSSYTDSYSSSLDVTQPSVTLPKINFKYGTNAYETSLEREKNFFLKPVKKETQNAEERNEFEESSFQNLRKLRQMLEEVESELKCSVFGNTNKKEKRSKSKEKKKNKKGKKNDVKENIRNCTGVKEKIDLAIPILRNISDELAKLSDASSSSTPSASALPSTVKPFIFTSSEPNKSKSASEKTNEHCSLNGTWTSTVLGIEMTVTVMPNMMLKVSINSKGESIINNNWSIHGLTLVKRGGPLMLAAVYPQGRKMASFLGQCKTCKDQELIFGIWTVYSYVRKYTDLWRAVETKLDILRKN